MCTHVRMVRPCLVCPVSCHPSCPSVPLPVKKFSPKMSKCLGSLAGTRAQGETCHAHAWLGVRRETHGVGWYRTKMLGEGKKTWVAWAAGTKKKHSMAAQPQPWHMGVHCCLTASTCQRNSVWDNICTLLKTNSKRKSQKNLLGERPMLIEEGRGRRGRVRVRDKRVCCCCMYARGMPCL